LGRAGNSQNVRPTPFGAGRRLAPTGRLLSGLQEQPEVIKHQPPQRLARAMVDRLPQFERLLVPRSPGVRAIESVVAFVESGHSGDPTGRTVDIPLCTALGAADATAKAGGLGRRGDKDIVSFETHGGLLSDVRRVDRAGAGFAKNENTRAKQRGRPPKRSTFRQFSVIFTVAAIVLNQPRVLIIGRR